MKKHLVLLLGLLGVALVVIPVLAGSSANFAIPWEVIGRGGNEMSSTNYGIKSTTGQTAIGPTGSGNYRLGAGYWYSMGPVEFPAFYDIFLPIIFKSF
jgi:hypothetical protein